MLFTSNTPITIYETKHFAKFSKKLLGTKERSHLLTYLIEYPKSGDIIPGSGGVRKLRWSRPGMGKRGGVWVIYYFMNNHGLISLLTLYIKSEKENMTKKEINEYKGIVEMIKREVEGD